MKKHLKTITNKTVNELLNNEVILPSNYLNSFNKHAQNLNIQLDDKEFENQMNNLFNEEINTIDTYMQSIMKNTDILTSATKQTKKALLDKDIESLNDVYRKIVKLEKELKQLNSKLYLDDVTNTFNRKWFYGKFLNKDGLFKENGVAILIDIKDYEYITDEYGELLSNNLLIFITRFIFRKLKEEEFDFKIVRHIDNQFLVLVKNKKLIETNNLILNLKKMLANTNLKSNSGLYIKANFEYSIKEYFKKNSSKDVFEGLINQLNE